MAMATMATARPQISVILTSEVKERLEKAAKNETRSLSQMSLILISEALDARDRNNGKKS
jgi:uncharacterized protein (DUF1778 family)